MDEFDWHIVWLLLAALALGFEIGWGFAIFF